MRKLLISAAVPIGLIVAVPAQAADRSADDIAATLNDPAMQEEFAAMATRMVGAMMRLPVGQIATSIETAIPPEYRDGDKPFADIPPDATLADIARADNPNFERDIAEKSRTGVAMMGAMAGGIAALLPQLREMAERMRGAIGDLPKSSDR
ncbi:MAG: hypothetical protein U5J78_03140 [Parasphingorhabdus sp.]|nr:hypothetical protein [Parasphingorhabdus sp.]